MDTNSPAKQKGNNNLASGENPKEQQPQTTNQTTPGVLLLNANQDPITLSAPLDPSIFQAAAQKEEKEEKEQEEDLAENNQQAHLWQTPQGPSKTNLKLNSTVNRTAEFRGTSDSKQNERDQQSQAKENEQVFVDAYGIDHQKQPGTFKQQFIKEASKNAEQNIQKAKILPLGQQSENGENSQENTSDLKDKEEKNLNKPSENALQTNGEEIEYDNENEEEDGEYGDEYGEEEEAEAEAEVEPDETDKGEHQLQAKNEYSSEEKHTSKENESVQIQFGKNTNQLGLQLEIQQSYGRNSAAIPQATANFKQDIDEALSKPDPTSDDDEELLLGNQEALDDLKDGDLKIQNTALFKNGAQNKNHLEDIEPDSAHNAYEQQTVEKEKEMPEVEQSGRNTADLLTGHKNKQDRVMKKRQDIDDIKEDSVLKKERDSGKKDPDTELLEAKRQSNPVNLNLISYQTANFGEYGSMKRAKEGEKPSAGNENIQNKSQTKKTDSASPEHNLSSFGGKIDKKPPKDENGLKIQKPSILIQNNNDVNQVESPEFKSSKKQNSPLPQQNMFASMSDINFVAAPPANSNPAVQNEEKSPDQRDQNSQIQIQGQNGSSSKVLQQDAVASGPFSAKENQSNQDSATKREAETNDNKSGNKKASLQQQHEQVSAAAISPFGAMQKTSKEQIISEIQKEKMTNMSNNWKVRTQTIDEIHIIIQDAIDNEPEIILEQSEALLDFFVSLLNDQNFKIVLMTLSIVNLIIGMPQQIIEEQREDQFVKHPAHFLSSVCLRKHVPRLVNKLSDSKNIIRQQAIRALLGTYLIMHMQSQDNLMKGKPQNEKSAPENATSPLQSPISSKSHTAFSTNENTFVLLVLPYLQNSSSWHVREELLNVLIICFLKSKDKIDAQVFLKVLIFKEFKSFHLFLPPKVSNFFPYVYSHRNDSFDQHKILEVFLKMLDDAKERIRFTALEAIVALVNVSDRNQMLQIIYNLGDQSVSELVNERFKAPAEMSPYLNINGALELPYLEHVELANQVQVDQILQRREGLQSGPAGQIKALSSHPLNNPNQKRGQSSGMNMAQNKQPICPPSANSLSAVAQYAQGVKRTASANNPKFLDPLPHAGIYPPNGNNRQTPLQNVEGMNSVHNKDQNNRSPLFNVFGGFGASEMAGNGGGVSQASAALQYGNSIRMNQRKSNERLNSGQSSSFLPSLTKHGSVYGATAASQQHGLASPQNGNMIKNRQLPQSENRFYSQQQMQSNNDGANGSNLGNKFHNQTNLQRRISANSHGQNLINGSGSQGSINRFQIQNNLSTHPINQLKRSAEGGQANSASNNSGRQQQQVKNAGQMSPMMPVGALSLHNYNPSSQDAFEKGSYTHTDTVGKNLTKNLMQMGGGGDGAQSEVNYLVNNPPGAFLEGHLSEHTPGDHFFTSMGLDLQNQSTFQKNQQHLLVLQRQQQSGNFAGNQTPNSAISPVNTASHLIPFDQQSQFSYNSRKQMDSQGGGGDTQKGRFSHKTLNQVDLAAGFDPQNFGSDQLGIPHQVFQTPNPQSRGGAVNQRGIMPTPQHAPGSTLHQMTQLNSQKKVIRYGQQVGSGGTFYSDTQSMMTKTTGVTNTNSTMQGNPQQTASASSQALGMMQVASKMRQTKQMRLQQQRTGSKQFQQPQPPSNHQQQQSEHHALGVGLDQNNNEFGHSSETGANIEQQLQQSLGIMGVQRGPVKATRQVTLRSEQSQQSLGSQQHQQQQMRGDSRQIKRNQMDPKNDQLLNKQELFIDNRRIVDVANNSHQGPNSSQQANYRQNINNSKAQQQAYNKNDERPLNNNSLINQNNDLSEFMNNYNIPPKDAHLGLNQQHSQITQRTAPLHPQSRDNQRKNNFTMMSSNRADSVSTAGQLGQGLITELGNHKMAASTFDEGNFGQAPGVTQSKVYLTSAELDPITPNPQKKFKSALQDLLQSADWNVQFDSCNIVRRVCKHHSELILQHGATLHSLIKQLTKLADSLRSSLAKQALMTVRDMFTYLKRCMEGYLDPLIRILLKKASDTNTFIAEEAEQALLAMTQHCNDSKVLHSLLSNQGANSKSNNQRLRLCRCLEQLAVGLGNNILFFKDSDKLICQLANYIKDASQDVRSSAKRAFISMNQSVMGQNDFEKLLQRVLNEGQYKKVRSFLDTEGKNPSSEYFMQSRPRPDIVIKTAAAPNSQVLAGAQQSLTGFGIQGSSTGQSRSHANQSTQDNNPTASNAISTNASGSASGFGGGGVGVVSRDLSVSNSGYFGQSQQQSSANMNNASSNTNNNSRADQQIALGQHATSKIRAMGAARGTLRTGPMSTMQKQREAQNGQLMIGGSNPSNASNLAGTSTNQANYNNSNHYGAVDSQGISSTDTNVQGGIPGGKANLNIKATQIVNPAKIVRARGRPNLKTKMSYQSSSSLQNAAASQQSATNSKTSLRDSQVLSTTNHNNIP